MSQTIYKPQPHWVSCHSENHWNVFCGALSSERGWRNRRNDDVHIGFHQLSGKPVKAVIVFISKSVHQVNVLALDVAKLIQSLPQCTEEDRLLFLIPRMP